MNLCSITSHNNHWKNVFANFFDCSCLHAYLLSLFVISYALNIVSFLLPLSFHPTALQCIHIVPSLLISIPTNDSHIQGCRNPPNGIFHP
jgi:hypothetical protein